jgi:hypothetical protein
MLYGQEVWDPVLIISKIIALQCIFYIGVGALMTMLVGESLTRRVRKQNHSSALIVTDRHRVVLL